LQVETHWSIAIALEILRTGRSRDQLPPVAEQSTTQADILRNRDSIGTWGEGRSIASDHYRKSRYGTGVITHAPADPIVELKGTIDWRSHIHGGCEQGSTDSTDASTE
jgi:hypothetical protein